MERIDSYAVSRATSSSAHVSAGYGQSQFTHRPRYRDGETITKANGFLYQLQSSTFLQILILFFRELTIKLQMKAVDVVYAYKRVVSTLKCMRSRSTIEFKKEFSEADKLGKLLHGDDFRLTADHIKALWSPSPP